MCYEMHQYTQKLSKTATNSTVSLPHVSLTTLCWWCETAPTTSITKLESAKSAVTGALILSQMQKKCVSLVSHLFYQLAALYFIYFHAASMITNIYTVSCRFSLVEWILCQELVRLALHSEGNNSRSARQQTDNDQHQYFIAFQSQTSYLIDCQSMLITRWSNSDLLLQQKLMIHSVIC